MRPPYDHSVAMWQICHQLWVMKQGSDYLLSKFGNNLSANMQQPDADCLQSHYLAASVLTACSGITWLLVCWLPAVVSPGHYGAACNVIIWPPVCWLPAVAPPGSNVLTACNGNTWPPLLKWHYLATSVLPVWNVLIACNGTICLPASPGHLGADCKGIT